MTLEKALSISIAVESAINQSSLISQHQANPINREDPPNVFKISESKSEKPCYRCDGNHRPETCAFKDKACYYCKAKGHTIKVCRKKKKY